MISILDIIKKIIIKIRPFRMPDSLKIKSGNRTRLLKIFIKIRL